MTDGTERSSAPVAAVAVPYLGVASLTDWLTRVPGYVGNYAACGLNANLDTLECLVIWDQTEQRKGCCIYAANNASAMASLHNVLTAWIVATE